ncbi:hypothetical protein BVC80_9069g110 [Macleaya cordata]|uniref:Protein EMBRYONIC FLOWER 1 n=1 Tax=Macleaya cordata TaxID=56857 RepID=A0A200PP41_MACCD|nr:hypothetical protein BVC80_9069g110 [Macleaya cordata]
MEEKVIEEENCGRSESTPLCKSSKSVFEMGSMELGDAEKRENGVCGHFSLRGYVAEIRKKDTKACWPFSNHKDFEKQANVLPPLHVCEFRWWGCQNCLMRTTDITVGEVADCYKTGFKKSNSSSHDNGIISSHGDAPRLLSGFQKASKENIFEGRKADLDTPSGVNGDKCDPSFCSHKKGKEAAAVHPIGDDNHPCKGCSDNAEKNVNQVTNGTIPGVTKVPGLIVDIFGTTEPNELKVSFEKDKHGCNSTPCGAAMASQSVAYPDKNGSKEFSDVAFDTGNPKCNGKRSTEICDKEKLGISRNNPTKSNNQHKKVLMDCGISEVSDLDPHKIEVLNAVKGQTTELHSKELDENDNGFSGNDENLVRHSIHDQHLSSQQDVSGGALQRKKVRKVRFLTDIIRSEAKDTSNKDRTSDRDPCRDNIMIKAAHYKAETGAPNGIDLHPDQRSQVAVEGNDRRVVPGNRKKRNNMSQEEDQGPPQMNMPKDATEAETGNVNIAVVDSRPLTKHGNDGMFTLDKKKRGRSKVENGQSSSTPWQESMSGEVLFTRRNVETEKIGDETIPSKSDREAFTGKGHSAARRGDKKIISGKNFKFSECQDAKSSLMHWPEDMSGKDQVIRRDLEKKHMASAALPFKYAGLTVGGVQQGLDHMATDKKADLNKKRNGMPQAEGGGNVPQFTLFGSSINFEAPSGTCNYENAADIQRHQNVSKTQSDESAKNTSKQAAFDDIPMEIVELMAKNQHERRLFSAEGTSGNSYCLSGTTEKVKDAGTKDFTEILGNEMSRLLYEKNSGLQKNHSSNEGSSISTKGKGVIPVNQKSDGYLFQVNNKNKNISFNISQPEQSHGSMGFAAFSQNHEKPSRILQLPVRGSGTNCGKNFSWNVDTVAHKCSSTCLPSTCLEAYKMSQKLSAQSSCREDHHAWSSMVPSRVPFEINVPQKFVSESSNSKVLSQCAEPLARGNLYGDHDLISVDRNNFHLQKQGRNFDSSKNKSTNSKYPFLCTEMGDDSHRKNMGPLDLYTNETIPAMHLLKLMDAGKNFTKQSPFPNNDLQKKDLSGLEIEQSKTSRHPLPSDLFDTNSLARSLEHFPSVLKFDTVGCSSQKNENLRRVTGSTGPSDKLMFYSPKTQEEEETKRKNPSTQPRGPRSNSSGKNHESVSVHNLQKGCSSASDSMPIEGHTQAMKNPVTHVELEVNQKHGTTWPVTTSCSTEFCSINRNPADFSAPGPGNFYMIGAADLKRRKMTPSRDKPGPSNQDGHKRQRMMKLTAIQGNLRH